MCVQGQQYTSVSFVSLAPFVLFLLHNRKIQVVSQNKLRYLTLQSPKIEVHLMLTEVLPLHSNNLAHRQMTAWITCVCCGAQCLILTTSSITGDSLSLLLCALKQGGERLAHIVWCDVMSFTKDSLFFL